MTVCFILLAVFCVLFAFYILLLRCRCDKTKWAGLLGVRYAHRGLHDKPRVPENSLAAFRAAIEAGYGAELDVHLLSDGTLAVFHDHTLNRCAGVDGKIENLDATSLSALRLEGTEEHIPTLDEVLALFEGKQPLIIELKSANKNGMALARAVCERLDTYKGTFCIESFDPQTLLYVKKLRPQFCRGQLSMNFFSPKEKHTPLKWYERFVATNLLLNFLTTPDFIAYCHTDRKNLSFRICRRLWGAKPFLWTVHGCHTADAYEKEGYTTIFELR